MDNNRINVKRYRPGVDPVPDDAKKSGKWDFAGPLLCVCTGCFVAMIAVLVIVAVG